MNPPLPDDPAANSPLATLRQLKEMLDAGAITQQEFEALKQQLIFGAAGAPVPATPAPLPPTPYLDGPAALTPEATPLLAPEPDWLAAPAPPLAPEEFDADDEEPAAERRNPLNLVFAIGGLLLFLGVVAYLTLGRPTTPDEHLTSTSQTAADSLAAPPEEGPQAEQLTLPPAAAPETLRVAPALPPPTTATTLAAVDSAASATAPAAVAPAPATAPAAKATAPKPAATKPAAASPTTTDTASTTP